MEFEEKCKAVLFNYRHRKQIGKPLIITESSYDVIMPALEKQISQKLVNYDNCGNKCATLRCPSCFEITSGKYCDNCGQRLKVGENDI